mmetsp:Transcript_23459/g.58710  ORF Transcript_23459/g.58710 Transcript_23459/m.58710 type:complete len:280 (-) Transcript_23459:876-1715(-)
MLPKISLCCSSSLHRNSSSFASCIASSSAGICGATCSSNKLTMTDVVRTGGRCVTGPVARLGEKSFGPLASLASLRSFALASFFSSRVGGVSDASSSMLAALAARTLGALWAGPVKRRSLENIFTNTRPPLRSASLPFFPFLAPARLVGFCTAGLSRSPATGRASAAAPPCDGGVCSAFAFSTEVASVDVAVDVGVREMGMAAPWSSSSPPYGWKSIDASSSDSPSSPYSSSSSSSSSSSLNQGCALISCRVARLTGSTTSMRLMRWHSDAGISGGNGL